MRKVVTAILARWVGVQVLLLLLGSPDGTGRQGTGGAVTAVAAVDSAAAIPGPGPGPGSGFVTMDKIVVIGTSRTVFFVIVVDTVILNVLVAVLVGMTLLLLAVGVASSVAKTLCRRRCDSATAIDSDVINVAAVAAEIVREVFALDLVITDVVIPELLIMVVLSLL